MKRFFYTVAALALTLLITSCTPPYRQTFNDEGKAKGWTQKQTDAAFAYADRTFWSREVGENKYVIAYGKIPTSKVREQLEGVLKDIDSGLDPKNEDMVQYLRTFNLRKDIEHDEEIAQAIYDRVHASELQTQFKQAMGDIPDYGEEAQAAQGYNIRKIYVAKPLAEAFPFTSDQIDAAQKSGSLKVISHVVLDMSNQYDHKKPNPDHPDDGNDFIWVARHEAIDLTEYKIVDVDKPLDNKGNYIEGFRVIEGKKESKPALRVFFPANGAIALVDYDEEGQPGFGVPDIIQRLSEETDAVSLARDGQLLDSLFTKKEAKKDRVVPEAKLFKIEILPIGGHIDEWQKSQDAAGWMVPFKYTNEKGDNFNVRIHYKKPSFNPETMTSASHSDYMEIEYIEKEFTRSGERYEASAGKVIEYFRPRSAGGFDGKVKAKVEFDDNTKKLTFEFEDGSVVEGFITPGKNKFLQDAPYAKSYNEGQKRWWIEKSSGSEVFDKRKPVGQPKEQTGEYSSDNYEDTMRGEQSARPSDDFGGNKKPLKVERETQQAPPTAKQ